MPLVIPYLILDPKPYCLILVEVVPLAALVPYPYAARAVCRVAKDMSIRLLIKDGIPKLTIRILQKAWKDTVRECRQRTRLVLNPEVSGHLKFGSVGY